MAAADRIVVAGAPGSGKSTMSRELAASACRNLVDLDRTIGRPFDGVGDGGDVESLGAQLESDRWVCDGTYADSIEDRLRIADLVVLLDLPAATCVSRVIARGRRRGEPVTSLPFLRMLLYTARFRLGIRGRIVRAARTHQVPLVRVRSARAGTRLLESASARGQVDESAT